MEVPIPSHVAPAVASVWEQDVWFGDVDLLVAGGGLLGLWTAIEAKTQNPSWKVLVAEQHAVPYGASTRNAGFACFGSASELSHDISLSGEDAVMRLVEWRWKGIRKIATTFAAASIGLEWCGGYEFLQDSNVHTTLEQLEHLNALVAPIVGVSNCFSQIEPEKWPYTARSFQALVCNAREGVLHSGLYVNALMNLAREKGVTLMHGLEWLETDESKDWLTIFTNRGKLRARLLVHATNAELTKHFPRLGVEPGRGQVMVASLGKPLQWRGSFHAREGFYYWRNLDGRLLIGGGRHTDIEGERTLDKHTTTAMLDHLREFVMHHFDCKQMIIDHAWAGTMAFTPNKQPLCEKLSPRSWAAMCCNGMGVALSPFFAERIVAEMSETLNHG